MCVIDSRSTTQSLGTSVVLPLIPTPTLVAAHQLTVRFSYTRRPRGPRTTTPPAPCLPDYKLFRLRCRGAIGDGDSGISRQTRNTVVLIGTLC